MEDITGRVKRREARTAVQKNGGMGMGILAQGINNTTRGLVWNRVEDDASMNMYRDQTELNRQVAGRQAEENYARTMRLWDDTNYKAQVGQMNKAGLNVGLMSGGGGQSPATNVAPASQQGPTLPGRSAGDNVMGIGPQAAQVASNIKLQEAQARNLDADTAKKQGVDTENTSADTEVKRSTAGLNNLQLEINKGTKEDLSARIVAEARKAEGEAKSAGAKGTVDEAVVEDDIKKRKAEAIGMIIQNQAGMAGIKLTEAQTKQVKQATQAMVLDMVVKGNQDKREDDKLSQSERMIDQKDVEIKLDAIFKEAGINITNKAVMAGAARSIMELMNMRQLQATPGRIGY